MLLIFVNHNWCENFLHRYHFYQTCFFIIRRKKLVNVVCKFRLCPTINDSWILILFDNLSQENMRLHMSLQQGLDLIQFWYFWQYNLLSTLNPFIFNKWQYLKPFIQQEPFIQRQRLLEHVLRQFRMLLIVIDNFLLIN